MKISDLMTKDVVSVSPETTLAAAIQLMTDRRVSGLPVVKDGVLVGLVTEGDLLRRAEIGTAEKSGWLASFFAPGSAAEAYVTANGQRIEEVMTQDVITIDENTSVAEAARLMQSKHIRRLPVIRGGKLVGILARADILRALAATLANRNGPPGTDAEISRLLYAEIQRQNWLPRLGFQAKVVDGVIELSGVLPDERERSALRVIAENIPGAKGVRDKLVCIEPISGAVIDSPGQG